MNVGNPSNLMRFFNLYSGILSKDGITYKVPDIEAIRKNLWAHSANDEATVQMIQQAYINKCLLLEPHGAAGLCAIEAYAEKHPFNAAIVLETAHPSKFENELNKILGGLYKKNKDAHVAFDEIIIPNSYEQFKALLKKECYGKC
jgi:threonine synthase